MNDDQITNLVINYILVESDSITIGATDNQRWKFNTQHDSGADAKSIVYVILKENGEGYSVSETAHFSCLPNDPTRKTAMAGLEKLFEIIWKVKNKELSTELAIEKYFGYKID